MSLAQWSGPPPFCKADSILQYSAMSYLYSADDLLHQAAPSALFLWQNIFNK